MKILSTLNFQKIKESVVEMSLDEDGDELNDYHFPELITYFIRQWAPIIPPWTATLICFIMNQKLFKNNEAVEAYFSSLKRY